MDRTLRHGTSRLGSTDPAKPTTPRRLPLALTLSMTLTLAALLAGCTSTSVVPGQSMSDAEAAAHGELQAGPESAVAEHGAPQRTDGPVSVSFGVMPGPGFTARQTITITNSVAGFPSAVASYSVGGGSSMIHPGDAGKYTHIVVLEATALTESDARAALATMHVDGSDFVRDGILHFGLETRMDPQNNQGIVGNGPQRTFHADAAVDASLAYALDAHVGGGSSEVGGLHGPALDASAGGGSLNVHDVTFGDVGASAGGGEVTIDAKVREANVRAGGGSIKARLEPIASGSFSVSVGGGSAEMALVRGQSIGYDVTARAGGGSADVTLHDASTQDSYGSKHATSPGFATAAIQTTVTATAGGGSVNVHD